MGNSNGYLTQGLRDSKSAAFCPPPPRPIYFHTLNRNERLCPGSRGQDESVIQ